LLLIAEWRPVLGFVRPYRAGLLLERGIAEITERNSAFTVLDDLKTAATSGPSTTVTASSDILEAKRLGFDLL
jgi:hypothetical protein